MTTTVVRLMSFLVLAAGGLVAGMTVNPDWFTGQSSELDQTASSTLVLPAGPMIDRLQQRFALRTAAVKRLLAGEATLLDTASWFRALNGGGPPVSEPFWPGEPSCSEGEKVCRQVLHWVEIELNNSQISHSEIKRRLAALETELKRSMGADGTILLP